MSNPSPPVVDHGGLIRSYRCYKAKFGRLDLSFLYGNVLKTKDYDRIHAFRGGVEETVVGGHCKPGDPSEAFVVIDHLNQFEVTCRWVSIEHRKPTVDRSTGKDISLSRIQSHVGAAESL